MCISIAAAVEGLALLGLQRVEQTGGINNLLADLME